MDTPDTKLLCLVVPSAAQNKDLAVARAFYQRGCGSNILVLEEVALPDDFSSFSFSAVLARGAPIHTLHPTAYETPKEFVSSGFP